MAAEPTANWKGAPPGVLADFRKLAAVTEEKVARLVTAEVDRAVRRGTVSKTFDGKLRRLLTAFRDEAALQVQTELTEVFSAEVNRFGRYYKRKLRGIVKPEPPEVFASKLRALQEVVNNVYAHATATVGQAAAYARIVGQLEAATRG